MWRAGRKLRTDFKLYFKQASCINNTISYIPIFLSFSYLTAYNFNNTENYINYYRIFQVLDNILVLSSILGFMLGGYKNWKLNSLRCFSFVLILNLLTEYSRYNNEIDYLKCYFGALMLFIVSFTITSIQTDD